MRVRVCVRACVLRQPGAGSFGACGVLGLVADSTVWWLIA